MRDYRKIHAWRMADELTVAIYEHTRQFPKEEIYGLTSQLRRCAYSVPANIAEGSARQSKRDYLHFLYMARGSLCEAQYFIHLAGRLHYFAHDQNLKLTDQIGVVFGCLPRLILAVESELPKS
ncbi:MAG TPA: four helix bundle protein [Verrucomicrobiota bacterium]|nr:four helix bundle protein [Verrucomicrobiota bacterium]